MKYFVAFTLTMTEHLRTMTCRKLYSIKKEKIDIVNFIGSSNSDLGDIDIEDEDDGFEEQYCNIVVPILVVVTMIAMTIFHLVSL